MNKSCLLASLLPVSYLAPAQTIHSPSRKLALTFALSAAGEPTYQLNFGTQTVLKPSRLGLRLQDQAGFAQGLMVARVDSSQHDDTWMPVWGETKTIRNHYQELAVTLQPAAAPRQQVVLRFRVFDDGLGFRYEFPTQPNLKYFVVSDELTGFALAGDHINTRIAARCRQVLTWLSCTVPASSAQATRASARRRLSPYFQK